MPENADKYFVCRVRKLSGVFSVQKCKCLDIWVGEQFIRDNPNAVWRFSKKGAENIVKRYGSYTQHPYVDYRYFIEPCDKVIEEARK